MKPKMIFWLIAVIIGIVGILIHKGIVNISAISKYNYWMLASAFAVLAITSLMKNK